MSGAATAAAPPTHSHGPTAMPELPDITVYCEALAGRLLGQRLVDVRIESPFLLRSVAPPVGDAVGREVVAIRRLGKRIALGFTDDLWLVLHLMIAGRLHWHERLPKGTKTRLASFTWPAGWLVLTEASPRRRASLTVVSGEAGLALHQPGGLDLFSASLDELAARLTSANHTLKRALTDPRLIDGIGNAYSDEILHAAGLSPLALTQRLSSEEIAGLFQAARQTLAEWTERLRAETGEGFPEGVTAFRPGMAVHGRFGQPCPRCGTTVQRIRYAENETNYCPRCQTGGRVLADRSLSRLLKDDWPRSIDEWE